MTVEGLLLLVLSMCLVTGIYEGQRWLQRRKERSDDNS